MLSTKELTQAVIKNRPTLIDTWAITAIIQRLKTEQYVAFDGPDYFILRPKPGDDTQAEIVDCSEKQQDTVKIVFCDWTYRTAHAFLLLVKLNTGCS